MRESIEMMTLIAPHTYLHINIIRRDKSFAQPRFAVRNFHALKSTTRSNEECLKLQINANYAKS